MVVGGEVRGLKESIGIRVEAWGMREEEEGR